VFPRPPDAGRFAVRASREAAATSRLENIDRKLRNEETREGKGKEENGKGGRGEWWISPSVSEADRVHCSLVVFMCFKYDEQICLSLCNFVHLLASLCLVFG